MELKYFLYLLGIPLIVAGFFVYRENYKQPTVYHNKKGEADPMTHKDYRNVHIVYWLIFTAVYIWLLGATRGIFASIVTLLIWTSWTIAVKKMRAK
jgi:hypothetical protein